MGTIPQARSLSEPGPVSALRSVTPSDTVDLADGTCRGFHCNVAGNVAFHDFTGNAVTLTVLAGVSYPYSASRILAAGTTATGIFALY